jgi:hypothetical protein
MISYSVENARLFFGSADKNQSSLTTAALDWQGMNQGL